MTDVTNILVFGTIVLLRIGVPLLIPRYPLPSIVAAMVIDAVDQTVFQVLTTLDLEGYQSYDKALDVYYLAIAYVSTLRNWSNLLAFEVSRFLWYYRLVGVTLFELIGSRALLLIFPNTFEYFFIWYEAVRTRWNPLRLVTTVVIGAAAGIWIFIKLPQEYWIHIAQLDTTDVIKEDILGVSTDTGWLDAISQNLWVIPVVIAIGALLYFAWRAISARLPQADWPLTIDPDEHRDFDYDEIPTATAARINVQAIIEKTFLVGLVSVVFAQMLPNVSANNLALFITVGVIICANAFISTWLARRGTSWSSTARQFGAMAIINLILAVVWIAIISDNRGAEDSTRVLVFFVLLLTLIVTLYDRYLPIHEYRVAQSAGKGAQPIDRTSWSSRESKPEVRP